MRKRGREAQKGQFSISTRTLLKCLQETSYSPVCHDQALCRAERSTWDPHRAEIGEIHQQQSPKWDKPDCRHVQIKDISAPFNGSPQL